MKALMFGWEFPPHISGGLGTACHGLTKALSAEGVEILFVVPVMKGGEEIVGGHMINASEVVLPTSCTTQIHEGEVVIEEDVTTKNISSWEVGRQQRLGYTTIIKVSSALSPYSETIETGLSRHINKWNYSFPERQSQDEWHSHSSMSTVKIKNEIPIVNGVKYGFTGMYGPSLLDEVDKYAQVASIIAGGNTFDVIHAHDWMTFQAGIAAKEISKKPLILHVHSTEFDRAGLHGNPYVHLLEREALLKADHIIAVSKWTRQLIVDRYKIDSSKISVVHNGASEKKKTVQFEAAFNAPVVTFLGRITYQKGPFYFVAAALKVLQKFPNVQFVIAGSGDLLPAMIERIALFKASSNFHFTGFLKEDDVEKIWAISDLYVMPSVSEPFGITPLEAIQAGVPVIISNQSGVSEVLAHAIKVDFWNVEALAEAICSVLRYKGLSSTMRKNSRDELKAITWSKAAKKIKTLYYELTLQNQSKP